MGELNQGMLEKARKADTVDELVTIAKENGINLSEKAAQELMKKLKPVDGVLEEEELESVAGGGCNSDTVCETLFEDGCPGYFF